MKASVETTYYYFPTEDTKLGPFTVTQLQKMQDEGKIPESASVLSSVNGNWHLLVDVLNGDHPYALNRRHTLGKCPRCHKEVTTITEASYGKCSHCRFPLGTPRRVAGIRKNTIYTIKHRYFCFRGRAVKTEYWSFLAMLATVGVVLSVFSFVFLLLSMDDFNLHLLNGRHISDLMQEAGGSKKALCGLFGFEAFVGVFCVIPVSGLAMRRLQDIGYSGYWYMLFLVPALLKGVTDAMLLLHAKQQVWQSLGGMVDSAWYCFYLFAAFVVLMILIPLKDSQPGPNKYGPSPKYPRY